MKSLILNGINVYYKLHEGKKILQSTLESNKSSNSESLNGLDSTIEELKMIELHPSLLKPGKRFLMDVFYPEDKIISYKNKCLMKEQSLIKKGESIMSIYLNLIKSRVETEKGRTEEPAEYV